tara:strand:- start:2172 stop:2777 length:606 start_codon:yes stop_codon:yes gene_type:complete
MSFGRHANTQEPEQIFNMLINEPKDSVRVRLLWVFRRAAIPRLDLKLFEWALCKNKDLRSAAISALSQVSDKKIYELGREIVLNQELFEDTVEVVDLFIKNYRNDIPQLLLTSLKGVDVDEYGMHSIGCSIIELVDQNCDSELSVLFNWVYEETPCTQCRYDAIIHLERLQQLNKRLINECKFDASEEIRDFVSNLNRYPN